MPKYLDLIYRVKDEASAALKKVRGQQDEAGRSSESLRQRLKGLKAQYTELKSALQLVGIGFDVVKQIVVGSYNAYKTYAEQQIAAARAAGKMTDALRLQAAELKTQADLQKAAGASQRQLGETVSRLLTLSLASIEITKREGIFHRATVAELQQEIAARMRLNLELERSQAQLNAYANAARNVGNETHGMHQQLTAAELRAQALNNTLRNIRSTVAGLSGQDWSVRLKLALSGEDAAMLAWLRGGQQGNVSGFQRWATGAGAGGGGGGGQGSTGAPRLQGNTQADRDRYNAAWTAWRNSLGSDQ
jgi:predicted  nucleic acid-binding Zn-ribbon protein